MKKLLTILVVALPVFFSVTSCKKTTYPPEIIATIDTISLNTFNVTFMLVDSAVNPEVVQIDGFASNYTPGTAFKPGVQLTFPVALGTYTIPGQASAFAYNSVTGNAGSKAVSGTVQVTLVGDNVSGIYNFICKDGTTVTNGTFNSHY